MLSLGRENPEGGIETQELELTAHQLHVGLGRENPEGGIETVIWRQCHSRAAGGLGRENPEGGIETEVAAFNAAERTKFGKRESRGRD